VELAQGNAAEALQTYNLRLMIYFYFECIESVGFLYRYKKAFALLRRKKAEREQRREQAGAGGAGTGNGGGANRGGEEDIDGEDVTGSGRSGQLSRALSVYDDGPSVGASGTLSFMEMLEENHFR
jgi:hypothetical protein